MGKKISLGIPPKNIPTAFLKEFTLNGKIRVLPWYFNDAYSSNEPIFYASDEIFKFMIESSEGKTKYYGQTDLWLYQALKRYPIQGKNIAVLGSNIPWYEAICFQYGAASVTTIEYNKITTDYSSLSIMTVDEYSKNNKKFDIVLSISSFEHDGLGRYGDPIDPSGDLKAMKNTINMLNPGGILILAVPIGVDTMVWNAHRIYGKIRFPMLISGWEIIDSFGFKEVHLSTDRGKYNYQPIFILRKDN